MKVRQADLRAFSVVSSDWDDPHSRENYAPERKLQWGPGAEASSESTQSQLVLTGQIFDIMKELMN